MEPTGDNARELFTQRTMFEVADTTAAIGPQVQG
jgi:hypothetical protein